MEDFIEKLASHHDPNTVDLARPRIVRTLKGSQRHNAPVGSPIVKQVKELAKLKKPITLNPETGRTVDAKKPDSQNNKLFAQRVEELKESIEKLDASAIKALLEKLESAKGLPRSKNYQKIREMLKKYLKDKAGKDDHVKDRVQD